MQILQYKNLSDDPVLNELAQNIAILCKLAKDISNAQLRSQIIRSANSCRSNLINYKSSLHNSVKIAINALFSSYASTRETILWLELFTAFNTLPTNESIALQTYFKNFAYKLIKLINTTISEHNIVWNTKGTQIFYHNPESLILFSKAKTNAINLYNVLQQADLPLLDEMLVNSSTSVAAQIIEGQAYIQYAPKVYVKFLNDCFKQIHSTQSHLHQITYHIPVDSSINISLETINYYISEYEELARLCCGLINSQNRSC